MTIPRSIRRIAAPALACILVLAGAGAARAAITQLITNGDFESSGVSLTGWTTADQPGGDGTFALQSGTTILIPSATVTVPVAAPPGPTHAAMSNGGAPGSHVLLQDFVVPTTVGFATLSFSLFVQNQALTATGAPAFFSPNTLDFGDFNVNNQQARVDIITNTAAPFSVASSDVLLNTFQTQPGNPAVSGYSTLTVDVTPLLRSHAGQTLGLRFAEVDNNNLFQLGVDQVSLVVNSVPEPGSFVLFGLGALAVIVSRRLRSAVG
jgi:hypothetical protein